MKIIHFLGAVLLIASAAYAQVQAGRIVGTIYDPNKAAVPAAHVTIKDEATNISRQVVTNDSGDYVVTPLNPGTYTISATAPGFETTVRSGVELVVGQGGRVDLELRLGATNIENRRNYAYQNCGNSLH